MSTREADVEIVLRIPGGWQHPEDLIRGLPAGYRLGPQSLVLPDERAIGFHPILADCAFPQVFRTACRRPARPAELAAVDSYRINIALCGPGGSIEAARAMLEAGAAILQAGGAGVFVDNSLLAHGRHDWLDLTDDGSSDAVSFAFVGIVRGQHTWTLGMHSIGLPDLVMRHVDTGPRLTRLIEVIRYICAVGRPVSDGQIVMENEGCRLQAVTTENSEFQPGSPMHNPFGRIKLIDLKTLAQEN